MGCQATDPVPPAHFTCPGTGRGTQEGSKGCQAPWTQVPDLGQVTVGAQLEAKISSSSASSSFSPKAVSS